MTKQGSVEGLRDVKDSLGCGAYEVCDLIHGFSTGRLDSMRPQLSNQGHGKANVNSTICHLPYAADVVNGRVGP